MLVLQRKLLESVELLTPEGASICTVQVVRVKLGSVRLAFTADPRLVKILRSEIAPPPLAAPPAGA